jgi:hypothetical protein
MDHVDTMLDAALLRTLRDCYPVRRDLVGQLRRMFCAGREIIPAGRNGGATERASSKPIAESLEWGRTMPDTHSLKLDILDRCALNGALRLLGLHASITRDGCA